MKLALAISDMAGTTVKDTWEDNDPRKFESTGNIVRHFFKAAFDKYLPGQVKDGSIDDVMGWKKKQAIDKLLADIYGEDIPAGLAENIFTDFEDACVDYYRENSRALPGAEDAIRLLQQAGIEVALDTGFTQRITDTIMEALGWNSLVARAVNSDQVENGRPARDMIDKSVRDSAIPGLQASEVVKIGDTVSDIQCGINAGCRLVIGVLSGTGKRAQFEELQAKYKGSGVEIRIASDIRYKRSSGDDYCF